ncbi:winged helix-turn-helix domain-containing protein [Morganella morganii]|uniref:winged helix-turn-helix domain-containing protein n=1 Tax=Morganella morganii TaxID=582 RepID=UPI001C7446A4|nr:winged helix-turn-helix domain-containing protein [Morganella morganii]QXO41480.1 winged helix-turn-helix domain-containing protein [Morganella morganii]
MEIANQIIFDNVVLYNRCTAKLVNILNPDNTATLTVPANECLAIIIKNAPEVTTQKQLFKDVWEVHGIPINTNTFYQNISILRKAFKQVGIDYDVIITIPRRGIEVAKNINMSTYSPPDSKEDNPPVCSLPRSIPAAKPGIQSISYSEKKDPANKNKDHSVFFYFMLFISFFL